ncbi:hypothetical protein [Streptomyces naphthomycinicus]|uniref:hypothetical protein n=1 Tax=Streptomyces naphthomycinicus TaxID=2872625 RepID=UPI0021F1B85C|nr:hypothetical protein [Streptomyces sp. TML10]
MADEQHKWLNRETAERLLRGESLEAVGPAARDQAERLSKALGALSAEAARAPGELPGEQGALAAFRKAREAAEAERAAAAHAAPASRAPAPGADAGLVRIGAPPRSGIPSGRPRWARPVRLALAAAMAAGMLGGVAMAAGSGVLPTPFHDDHPRPGASVSAGTTSGQPLTPASPSATPGAGTGTSTPDGGTAGRRGTGSDEAAGNGDGTGRSAAPGSGAPSATSGSGRLRVAEACRALRDGRGLDAGRKRKLENLAGGSARVTRYCKVLLATGGSAAGTANGGTAGGGKGRGEDGDRGKGGDTSGDKGGDKDGRGRDKGGDEDGRGRDKGGDEDGRGEDRGRDDGGSVRPGHGHAHGGRHRGGAAPAPSAFAPDPAQRDANQGIPSPNPSYTAL